MATRRVTSKRAKLVAEPQGETLATLSLGDFVVEVSRKGRHVEVRSEKGDGFLAASALAPALPPEARAEDIRIAGERVLGPSGLAFGKLFRLGLFQFGSTSLDRFFARNPEAFTDLSRSRVRVMRAVSENEGKIEAINTWDTAFLSVGIYQWTIGTGSDAGELATLLDTLRQQSPEAFERYFGVLGLGVTGMAATAGAVPKGFLTLDGRKIDTPAEKETFRSHLWAYRFWRAAHDEAMQRAQVSLAQSRIDIFHRYPFSELRGLTIADLVTSEFGIALLLDQHVNRPAHVPDSLWIAAKARLAKPGKADPKRWTTDDERQVLRHYLEERAKTSMTDSTGRADKIYAHVKARRLSEARGSFKG